MTARRAGARIAAVAVFVGFALSGRAAPPATDTLLAALQTELARSNDLKLESLDRPYYVSYTLADTVTFETEATLGQLVGASTATHMRLFRPEVRVGSAELDNTEFVGTRSFFLRSDVPHPAVIEDDATALRRDFWLATDETYKGAVEQLSQKRAALKNRVETDKIADFTSEPPATAILPSPEPALEVGSWREEVRRLSALFREFPAVQDSSVRVRAAAGRKYFVSTEGSEIRQRVGVAVLSVRAMGQASDGQPVRSFDSFSARTLDGLPAEKELETAVRRVAQSVTRYAAAPLGESYAGPVLFTGQAAAELFAQILVPQLSGHRPPVVEREQMAAMMPRIDLAERLDRPVLPSFLSIVDDPTREAFAGRPLLGHYAYDDQGVKATPVSLVEKGVLKALLMSRRPRKEIRRSNGHARGSAVGAPGAAIGNLFIESVEGQAVADPKQELIRRCREQGLKFGLVVRLLDQPGVSGSTPPGGGMPFGMAGRASKPTITAPLEISKVFVEDGREEPVRGLVAGEITLRTLKDIVASGSDPFVHNRSVAAGGGIFSMAAAMMGSEEGGVPAAIVAPSVIVGELEFSREPGARNKPPLLPSPLEIWNRKH